MGTEDRVEERPVLYSPWQIFAASALGSPAAAAWFISRNYRAMSQPTKVRASLILGGLATFALFLVAPLIPDGTPSSGLPLVYSIAIYHYARHLFEPVYEKHVAAGGQRGSWWRVVGTALLIAIALFGVLLLVALLFPSLLE